MAYSDTISAMLSMMIRWYCQLSLYMINAPLYCCNISFFSRDISSEQAVVFWFRSPSLSKDYCIHSFWSQNTEKRNNTISRMRLRSVFKMRASILNTATTEQMGYGIISFFCVLAPEGMNSIVFGEIKGDRSEVYCLLERYLIRRLYSIFNE